MVASLIAANGEVKLEPVITGVVGGKLALLLGRPMKRFKTFYIPSLFYIIKESSSPKFLAWKNVVNRKKKESADICCGIAAVRATCVDNISYAVNYTLNSLLCVSHTLLRLY